MAMVFISSKSEDFGQARKVYDFLTAQGYSCFFSDETLEAMGQTDYKDAIDSALESAQHLVVVTSSREYAESKWVKYEWNTFANELLSGRKNGNLLTVACGGLKPDQLPLALRQRQVLSFENELSRLPRFLPGPRGSCEPGELIQRKREEAHPLLRGTRQSKSQPKLSRERVFIIAISAILLGLLLPGGVCFWPPIIPRKPTSAMVPVSSPSMAPLNKTEASPSVAVEKGGGNGGSVRASYLVIRRSMIDYEMIKLSKQMVQSAEEEVKMNGGVTNKSQEEERKKKLKQLELEHSAIEKELDQIKKRLDEALPTDFKNFA